MVERHWTKPIATALLPSVSDRDCLVRQAVDLLIALCLTIADANPEVDSDADGDDAPKDLSLDAYLA